MPDKVGNVIDNSGEVHDIIITSLNALNNWNINSLEDITHFCYKCTKLNDSSVLANWDSRLPEGLNKNCAFIQANKKPNWNITCN